MIQELTSHLNSIDNFHTSFLALKNKYTGSTGENIDIQQRYTATINNIKSAYDTASSDLENIVANITFPSIKYAKPPITAKITAPNTLKNYIDKSNTILDTYLELDWNTKVSNSKWITEYPTWKTNVQTLLSQINTTMYTDQTNNPSFITEVTKVIGFITKMKSQHLAPSLATIDKVQKIVTMLTELITNWNKIIQGILDNVALINSLEADHISKLSVASYSNTLSHFYTYMATVKVPKGVTKYVNDIKSLHTHLVNLNTDIVNKDAAIEGYYNQLASLGADINNIQTSITQKKQLYATLNKTLSIYNSKQQALTNQKQQLTTKLATFQNKVKALQSQINTLADKYNREYTKYKTMLANTHNVVVPHTQTNTVDVGNTTSAPKSSSSIAKGTTFGAFGGRGGGSVGFTR